MAAPVPYDRLKNFTQYALEHTEDPYNASDHDAELNAVQRTIAGILMNRALIQRDDGALANHSVHPDSLSTATLLLIEAAGSATGLAGLVRGLWVSATSYLPGQIVQNGSTSYIAALAHVSGTFATDFTAGKWIILGETAAAGASVVSFTPAGSISSINVQAAIQELDTEKAALAGSATQQFSVADASAAASAISMGQLQKNTIKTAIGTGTPDAIVATVLSGLTVLTDGMEFIIEAPGTNTLTAPTFNLTLGSTATGARAIVKGNNVPLIAGDIASNKCKFIYDLSLDKWVLINPLYQVGLSASASVSGGVKNLGVAFSVGGGALSASVVTATGSTPTSGSPIEVSMRDANQTLGTFNIRTITAAVSLVISNGSTLNHASGIVEKIHWYLIDAAGVLELAASARFLGFSGIVTTVAEGGAGAADAFEVVYSATARANVPYVWIAETTDTQITAGSWLASPVLVNAVADQVTDALVPSGIIPITATVSGNAMTLALLPCVLDFRSPAPGSGQVNRRNVPSTITTVISAGSTGGTVNGSPGRFYVLAIDVNGVVELAWCNAAVGFNFNESTLTTTTAEGGAGGADSAGAVIYSTTARTNVPYRVVGYVEFTQAVAGTWATAPSKVQGVGGASLLDALPRVSTQFFALAAAGNWITPPWTTLSTLFKFTLIGGGGGGGGSNAANVVAGGGGAGGAVVFYLSGLLPNITCPVVIGGGGGGGSAAASNGGNGGLSSITINGVVYSCGGGFGGGGTTTAVVNTNNGQGAISASITGGPNIQIYQSNSTAGFASSPVFVGSNGAGLSGYGTCGFAGRSGSGPTAGSGYGVGGGGGVGNAMNGGAGMPGLFLAEYI
jgi:hypothetical protein